jgi:N-acetylmuramoyl-L-alanine amidase
MRKRHSQLTIGESVMASGTVIIDPGHGGNVEVGGSSANNATSPSGVLEKNMTLRMGMLVRDALSKLAAADNHNIKVVLTRDADKNIGLRDRAAVAVSHEADIFLSIHFNASEQHSARGVETLVSPKDRNSNHADDVALATRVQKAVFNAIKTHDPNTRDRKVKDQPLSVLNERHLGKKARGCLVEIEFIDVPPVDQLLNLSENAPDVRKGIAAAVARALVEDLEAH